MAKIYNLQRMKGAELVDGEVELWGPPDIAFGRVISLNRKTDRSSSVLFTSNKEFDDFIDYFNTFSDYAFKNVDWEMSFFHGAYEKTKSQKTEMHDALSARHAGTGLRSASNVVQGDGIGSEVARFALDAVEDADNFGASALIGPLFKALRIIRTRYYVLACITNKYGQLGSVHNAKSKRLFLNAPAKMGASSAKTFGEVAIALNDFKMTRTKKFGHASVDLP